MRIGDCARSKIRTFASESARDGSEVFLVAMCEPSGVRIGRLRPSYGTNPSGCSATFDDEFTDFASGAGAATCERFGLRELS